MRQSALIIYLGYYYTTHVRSGGTSTEDLFVNFSERGISCPRDRGMQLTSTRYNSSTVNNYNFDKTTFA